MSDPADAARTRRRWITLAEFVAVAGLLIAALRLWSNWAERREDAAERARSDAAATRANGRLALTGKVADDGRAVMLDGGGHALSDVTFLFPRALGVEPQQPADATLRADWIEAAVLRLTDGGPDARVGRVPVLVSVAYWDGDAARSDRALYDIVYRTHARALRGRGFALTDFRLRRPHATAAMLEAAWTRAKP